MTRQINGVMKDIPAQNEAQCNTTSKGKNSNRNDQYAAIFDKT